MERDWVVQLAVEFRPEVVALAQEVQDELANYIELLQKREPLLSRPRADTLNGFRYANMKELRFSAADSEWRVAFAFDPKRHAILLVAGDKPGGSEGRFYSELIRKADERFGAHLRRLGNKEKQC